MTEGSSAQSLTGVWHGIYSYPIARAPVSFVATLIESASAVTGTTHEPCAVGGSPNDVLYATLSGSRHDSAVASPVGATAASLQTEAQHFALAANALFVAAGVVAVAGIVWEIHDRRRVHVTSTGVAIAF